MGRGGGDCSFTAPGGRLCNPQYQDLINPHLLFTSSNKSFRIGSPLLFARVRRNERFVHLQLLPLFYTCVLFFRLCRLFCSSRQYRFIVLVLYVTFTRVELGFKKISIEVPLNLSLRSVFWFQTYCYSMQINTDRINSLFQNLTSRCQSSLITSLIPIYITV